MSIWIHFNLYISSIYCLVDIAVKEILKSLTTISIQNLNKFQYFVLKLDSPLVKVSILLLERSSLTSVERLTRICGISGQNLPVIWSSVKGTEFRMGRKYVSSDTKGFALYTVLRPHIFIDNSCPIIFCHKFRRYVYSPTGIASSRKRIPQEHLG